MCLLLGGLGTYHRCPGGPGMHAAGQLCAWHSSAAILSVLSPLPSLTAARDEVTTVSSDLLMLACFMLGYRVSPAAVLVCASVHTVVWRVTG